MSGGIDDSRRGWGGVDSGTTLGPPWLGSLAAGALLRRVGSLGVLLRGHLAHRISLLPLPALVLSLAANPAHGVQAENLRPLQKLNQRLVQVVGNRL